LHEAIKKSGIFSNGIQVCAFIFCAIGFVNKSLHN